MRKTTVLVVEDDRSAQEAICRILQTIEPPLEIEVVHDGRAALEFLGRQEADLVCLDLVLPNLSGFEVCEAIRQSLGRKTPILITSIRILPEDRAMAEEMGANAFLAKPLKAPIFVEQVRSLLRLDPVLVAQTEPLSSLGA